MSILATLSRRLIPDGENRDTLTRLAMVLYQVVAGGEYG